MGFRCGIVGLPNVGKSTLFNALTRTAAAQAANYPFCTIEPNTGDVAVPDPRLDKLAAIVNPAQIVPTRISFVDIAGLVRGASKGEGLGNQFLANIREVDAVVHVLRCFEDGDVTHVEGRIDPVADAETVNTELMLADLASLERRVNPLRKRAQSGDKDAKDRGGPDGRRADAALGRQAGAADRGAQGRGGPVPLLQPVDRQAGALRRQCRGSGGRRAATPIPGASKRWPRAEGAGAVVFSAEIEAEVAQLADEEEHEFLETLGLHEPGLDRLIRAGYDLLGLITFFTAGPKEVRAWTVPAGARAPQAAGTIHTDFEKGFIRAQTIAYDDYIALGGEQAAKDAGKARDEGKDYVVRDGDVMLFKFNV